jgi:hypothetical protein
MTLIVTNWLVAVDELPKILDSVYCLIEGIKLGTNFSLTTIF